MTIECDKKREKPTHTRTKSEREAERKRAMPICLYMDSPLHTTNESLPRAYEKGMTLDWFNWNKKGLIFIMHSYWIVCVCVLCIYVYTWTMYVHRRKKSLFIYSSRVTITTLNEATQIRCETYAIWCGKREKYLRLSQSKQ